MPPHPNRPTAHARGGARERSSARGYSLPEVLAALAIAGLVATIGVYAVKTQGWRSSATARDLTSRLEVARGRAVMQQNDFRVTFDPDAATYAVHDDLNNNGTVETELGETVTTYALSASGGGVVFGAPSGTKGIDGSDIGDPITLSGDTVTFTPLGTAATGVVYLIPQEDLASGDPSHMRAISISAATARIRRWRYDAASGGPGPWRLEK